MTQEEFKHILTTQLPIGWIAGVRLGSFEENKVSTYVELDFLNQNPFRSMFWAVQGMAAEFSGGMMLVEKVKKTGYDISTLVVGLETVFTKKAVGKITFTCEDGLLIDEKLKEAIDTKKGVMMVLTSTGIDEQGDQVAQFKFTWSAKVRA